MLLIADTHVPKRARDLPAALWRDIERADIVVHAGDWVDLDLVDAVRVRARRLVGVRGNNDGPSFDGVLPTEARFEVEGVRVAVVHETGAAAGRDRRMIAAFPDVDVLVFGHSHIPWDSVAVDVDGRRLRLLNPGSPTDRRRQPTCTWMRVQVDPRLGGADGLRVELVRRDEARREVHSRHQLRNGV